jgi:transcription elongation factor Elf1
MELWVGEEQEICAVCGRLDHCVQFVDEKEQVYLYCICGLCMATAMEAVTGHRWINQYKSWVALAKFKNAPRVRWKELDQ